MAPDKPDRKDFYIYKCLREIHRINQEELIRNRRGEVLLILNTPGSLEHFMVHTDPGMIRDVFNAILEYTIDHFGGETIEFGYKLGKDDQLAFYVREPIDITKGLTKFEQEFEEEAGLITDMSETLSSLGGKIWIDRKDEAYRYFWFTVDIEPPGQRCEVETAGENQLPDWKDKTILIVDDVRTNLILLENFLNPTEATVISVDNGLKAINTVKKNNSIDFVLMDVRMPVLDGYEATRRIKRIKPWLPVVAISAYPASAESEKWRLAGCDAYFGKPLNFRSLFDAMESLMENAHAHI